MAGNQVKDAGRKEQHAEDRDDKFRQGARDEREHRADRVEEAVPTIGGVYAHQ